MIDDGEDWLLQSYTLRWLKGFQNPLLSDSVIDTFEILSFSEGDSRKEKGLEDCIISSKLRLFNQ